VSVLVADAPTAAAGDESCCPACAAALADDQRFCLSCGLRLAPDELRLAALPLLAVPPAQVPLAAVGAGGGFPQPVVRSAAITAVVVLVLGIAIGATIGPSAVGGTAVAQQRALIVVTTPPAAAPAPAASDDRAPADDGGDAPDEVQTFADAGTGTEEPAAEVPAEQTPASVPPVDAAPRDDQPAAPDVPPPGSLALAGVVATVAADGEGFVLAARDGRLLHVHANGCGVAPGDDLHLRARQLANGTWSADRVRRVAGANALRVTGTVVWADAASGRYALGARGALLFVTVPSSAPAPAPAAPVDPAATTPAPAPPPPTVPAVGAQLRVRLQPLAAHDGQPAALVEQVRRDAPPADPAAPAPPLELSGLVQSTDVQARTLVLALDPDVQPPLTVALNAPATVDLTKLLPAERVAVTAVPQPDGSMALSGLSPDGDALAADDATTFLSDQAPSTPAPGEDSTTTTTAATCTPLAGPHDPAPQG